MSPISPMGTIVILFTVLFYFTLQKVSSTRSPYSLALLAELELDIYIDLVNPDKQLNLQLKEVLIIIYKFLTDFEESALNVAKIFRNKKGYGIEITNNPLMSYRMTRRYALMLYPNYKTLRKILNPVLKKKFGTEEFKRWKWPTTLDLNDAMQALLRIHHVYNINLRQFTSGNIFGSQYPLELSARQCFEIGEFALGLKQYTKAIMWLEMALSKAGNKSDNGFKKNISNSLKISIEAHNIAWDTKSERDYYFFQEKLNKSNTSDKMSFRQNISLLLNNEIRLMIDDEVRFWELCSGRNFQTNQELAQLFCWYNTRQFSGFWTINPLKMEQISISPNVKQIYDVLGDKFISELKRQSIPTLNRPLTSSQDDPTVIDQDSVKGILNHSDKTRKLFKIVESISGYDPVGEKLAVTAYAWGGFDGGHLDILPNVYKLSALGNRMATMLLYLEEPKHGGMTAFTRIGVIGKPVKGSIIMYYNLLKNGDPDLRSSWRMSGSNGTKVDFYQSYTRRSANI